MVHGFNSGRETAWGLFPSLILDDPDFADFNLHRFGYPTHLLGQVSDIRDQGELLASFLRQTLVAYHSTVLVGHSIGGLVVLHALLSIERQDVTLLLDRNVKVVTFGTPFAGVQNAAMLRVLGNAQVEDVEALNKHLYRLKQEWEQRFNTIERPGEKAPRVPIYAYYGTEDGFVLPASACGGPSKTCEAVDGDHNTMVKPIHREHLAYQKLRMIAVETSPRARPTLPGKIGIWVARMLGDNDVSRAQGSIIENLRTHVARETELKSMLEVRELPYTITGSTDEEEEMEAERLGRQYNATVLVWGKITGLFKSDEFHPKVMLVARTGITSEPLRLPPITETLQQQAQMSSPPGTIGLPPEPIREPVQLARLVIAFTYIEQQKWSEAAEQFKQFIESGMSAAVKVPDVYFYIGFVNNNVHAKTGSSESLQAAKEAYLQALKGHIQDGAWDKYAGAQNNLGLTFRIFAGRGVAPEENLLLSINTFQEAASRFKGQQNWSGYALTQNNLGITYGVLAERGVAPEQNLLLSISAFQEANLHYKNQEDWAGYTMVKNNLALVHRMLAGRGVKPDENLQISFAALLESAKFRADQGDWAGYAEVQSNLGMVYGALAGRGIEPKQNLKLSIAAIEEAARYFKEQQNSAGYAVVQNNLGVTYSTMARQGVEPRENLRYSIGAYREAAQSYRNQENWADYAGVQINLGLAYRALAELDFEAEQNLELSIAALQQAICHFKAQENWAGYAIAQNGLGMAYGTLVERNVAPERNFPLCIAAIHEAANHFKNQENWAGCAMAQNNLGLAYRLLAGRGIEPKENFHFSISALQGAAQSYKKQEDWAGLSCTP